MNSGLDKVIDVIMIVVMILAVIAGVGIVVLLWLDVFKAAAPLLGSGG